MSTYYANFKKIYIIVLNIEHCLDVKILFSILSRYCIFYLITKTLSYQQQQEIAAQLGPVIQLGDGVRSAIEPQQPPPVHAVGSKTGPGGDIYSTVNKSRSYSDREPEQGHIVSFVHINVFLLSSAYSTYIF